MSDWYGDEQKDWTKFQLFNSTAYGGYNLIFKDSTTELKGITSEKRTAEGFLGDDYIKDLEALKSCAGIQPTSKTTEVTTPGERFPNETDGDARRLP